MMRSSGTAYSYFELLDACQESGCPLCRLGNTAARRNLQTLIFEGVNDYGLRATLRESLGYCHQHAWLLPEAGESAALGIAIVHRDLLNTVQKRLLDSKFDKSNKRRLRSFFAEAISPNENNLTDAHSARYLAVEASCPACKDQAKIEKLALKSLMEALGKGDEKMFLALERSDGLCLPHLRWAMEKAPNDKIFSDLVSISTAQLSSLIQDLDEFIRKNDHRFRDEKVTEQERQSWRRALERMVGQKK